MIALRSAQHVLAAAASTNHRTMLVPTLSPSTSKPAWLDVLAGIELQHGHHAAAERLAQRAEAMRGRVAR